MPDPSELTWPPTLVGDSPYGIISRKIIDVMKDEPAYKLYVSGHRCLSWKSCTDSSMATYL